MKKIFSIAVLGSLTVMPVMAGPWVNMSPKACGSANEYYRLGNGLCLECDDDSGDAPAKTRAYWKGSGGVWNRKCYISPHLTGDDKWSDAQSVGQCANNKCSNPKAKIPTEKNLFICGKANLGIKTMGDSVLVQGGTSDAVDCYFVGCDINNPIGSKKTANNCGDGIDPNATKCEQVCIYGANKYTAKWETYVKECKSGMQPGGFREYGYTNCVGGTGGEEEGVPVKKGCASYGLNEKQSKEISCDIAGIKGGKKCYVRCNSNETITFYTTECISGEPYNQVPGGDDVWKGKYLNCPTVSSCSDGSSEAFITQESCLNKGTFKCTKTSADGIQCLCGKCEAAPEKPSAPEKPQESSLDRCLKSRSTAEGKACCYLPNKIATWTNNACTCVGDSMEFKIGPDGRGTCNAKAPEVGEKFECDASILATMQTWAKECVFKKPSVVSMVSTIAALCVSDDRTYEKFNTQYSTLLALNPGDCAEVVDDSDEIHNDVGVAQTAISEAVASLDSITADLEVSKWKDEEGKFNTARLASDSIAGVVLGTAGGLITSSVVKKSQVEDGFEDLKCVIGGQSVADWGDEFTVGVQ